MTIEQLFVGASPLAAEQLAPLVDDLCEMGYDILVDCSLPNGPDWWNKSLDMVGQADAFVYGLTSSSVESEICQRQCTYAVGLGRPILPVLLRDDLAYSDLPENIGNIQQIDYTSAGIARAADLFRAIETSSISTGAAAGPRPPVPDAFQIDIPAELVSTDYINPPTQAAIIFQLESLVENGFIGESVRQLVARMRARTDITRSSSERLRSLDDQLLGLAAVETHLSTFTTDNSAAFPAGLPRPRSAFVSYSRQQADQVTSLVADCRSLGLTVWLDQNLPGGQQWWNQILMNIRDADLFLFVFSNLSFESRACLAELEYADGLRKPIVRVDLAQNSVLTTPIPESLSSARGIDYSVRDSHTMCRLANVLRHLSATALPSELPDQPAVPATYLFDLRSRVRTKQDLRPDEQQVILAELQRRHEEGVAVNQLRALVLEFGRRDDLTVGVAEQVERLGESLQVQSHARSDVADLPPTEGHPIGVLDADERPSQQLLGRDRVAAVDGAQLGESTAAYPVAPDSLESPAGESDSLRSAARHPTPVLVSLVLVCAAGYIATLFVPIYSDTTGTHASDTGWASPVDKWFNLLLPVGALAGCIVALARLSPKRAAFEFCLGGFWSVLVLGLSFNWIQIFEVSSVNHYSLGYIYSALLFLSALAALAGVVLAWQWGRQIAPRPRRVEFIGILSGTLFMLFSVVGAWSRDAGSTSQFAGPLFWTASVLLLGAFISLLLVRFSHLVSKTSAAAALLVSGLYGVGWFGIDVVFGEGKLFGGWPAFLATIGSAGVAVVGWVRWREGARVNAAGVPPAVL